MVYYKGRVFGRWAISTGRPGDDSADGTCLTTFKNNPPLMAGPGYSLEVPWPAGITCSGEFIHDAGWSVGVQGLANVSRGCVNTSPAHAETYYKMEEPGDPATVTAARARGCRAMAGPSGSFPGRSGCTAARPGMRSLPGGTEVRSSARHRCRASPAARRWTSRARGTPTRIPDAPVGVEAR
jgi:hypothetical protein